MKRPSIRLNVYLSPDDPRDLEIIKSLRDVGLRRRVVKLKHLAYEGIMVDKQPRAQVLPDETVQPKQGSARPTNEVPVAPKSAAATSIQQQAPEEYVPEYGDPSEFLKMLEAQAERFATHSWDGK